MTSVAGVPERIGHADLLAALRSLGFDPSNIQAIRFELGAVFAVVFERNECGHQIVDRDNNYLVTREVCIPITEFAGLTEEPVYIRRGEVVMHAHAPCYAGSPADLVKALTKAEQGGQLDALKRRFK